MNSTLHFPGFHDELQNVIRYLICFKTVYYPALWDHTVWLLLSIHAMDAFFRLILLSVRMSLSMYSWSPVPFILWWYNFCSLGKQSLAYKWVIYVYLNPCSTYLSHYRKTCYRSIAAESYSFMGVFLDQNGISFSQPIRYICFVVASTHFNSQFMWIHVLFF